MQDAKRLGAERIGKLLWELAIPAMVGMFVNSLYNIVDRLYIGQGCGREALAGLTLTLPYMMILASFGTLIGVGSSALLSIRLGENRLEEAEKLLGQCVAVKILFFIFVPIIAFFTLDWTLLKFGGNADSIPYAREYLEIILIGNIWAHLSFGLSGLMRAEGHSKKAMYCMIIGAVANIALDPIFIFVFDMGIRGAAHATNIAMFLSTCYAIHHFTSRNCVVPLKRKYIRVFPRIIPAVFAIGLSPFLMQLVASAVQVFFNKGFMKYSATEAENTLAVACSGIVNGVLIFIIQPAFGLSQGMQPIVGYNHGAGQYKRVAKAWRLGILYGTAICTFGTALCMTFAPFLARCFTPDPAAIKMSSWALRVCCAGFPFIGVGIMSTTYFQSVGRAKIAIFMSLLRQVLLLLPMIWLLPKYFGLNGIWFAGPVSDTLSFVMMLTVALFEFRHLRRLADKQKADATAAAVVAAS